MYETIKKFLAEGGKCLLIENGKPVGVILTMEEYDKLKNKPEIVEPKINKEGASAELADFDIEDDITLEDLGLDELPN